MDGDTEAVLDSPEATSPLDRLRDLANTMRNVDPAELSVAAVHAWAHELEKHVSSCAASRGAESPAPCSGSQAVTPKPIRVSPAVTPRKADLSSSGIKEGGYLHISDNGKIGERQLMLRPRLSAAMLRNLSICVFSVVESIRAQIDCEMVSLFVPYRGMSSEFRCLCKVSNTSTKASSGSGILRGSNTLEYACLQTGYIINASPKATVALEDKKGTECLSLLELICGKKKKDSKHPLSRMCCPIKSKRRTTPLGVVTVVAARDTPFDGAEENFLFDASVVLGTLLERCDDSVALQQCLATEEFSLPAAVDAPCDIPHHDTQLTYRAHLGALSEGETIRVIGKDQNTKTLKEGSPIMSVFAHMSQLVKAWNSSVMLNVELQRLCEEKEAYVASLLARARLSAAPPQEQERV